MMADHNDCELEEKEQEQEHQDKHKDKEPKPKDANSINHLKLFDFSRCIMDLSDFSLSSKSCAFCCCNIVT